MKTGEHQRSKLKIYNKITQKNLKWWHVPPVPYCTLYCTPAYWLSPHRVPLILWASCRSTCRIAVWMGFGKEWAASGPFWSSSSASIPVYRLCSPLPELSAGPLSNDSPWSSALAPPLHPKTFSPGSTARAQRELCEERHNIYSIQCKWCSISAN